MHCYIISPYPTHPQKGTYNTSFVTAALTSCTFQITLQNTVSHIKVLSGTTPLYLSDLTQKYIPVRLLMFRSESYLLLKVPESHTAMYVEKSFRASVPRLWNKLPNHIKLVTSKYIFCKVLKPNFLILAYLLIIIQFICVSKCVCAI